MVPGMLGAIALLGAMMVAPGAGVALAVYPLGTLGLPLRIGLVAGFGFVVPAVVAYALAATHLLYPAAFFITLGAATAAAWVVALRRGGLSDHLQRAADEIRSDPWSPTAGLLVTIVLAVAHLPLLSSFDPTIPFRYYSDGMQLAVTHRLPDVSVDYGHFFAPTVSKTLLNAFNGATNFVVPNPAVAAGVLAWFAVIMTAIALWVLGRAFGLRYTAALLPLLAIAAPDFLNRTFGSGLDTYRAEPFVRPIAIVALAVGILAIRRGHRHDLFVAAILFGAAGAGHLIPAVAMLMFFGSYAVSYLLLRRHLSEALTVIRRVVIVCGGAAVLVAVMVVGSHGDMGFQGTGGGESYTLMNGRYDPTRYLKSGKLEPPQPGETSYLQPRRVVRAYFDASIGKADVGRDKYMRPFADERTLLFSLTIPLVTLVAAIGQLVLVRDDRRFLGLTSWLFAAAMIITALAFSYRYDFWILATAGVRRFYGYSSLPVIVWALSVVDVAIERAHKKKVFRSIPVIIAIAGVVWLLPAQRAVPSGLDHVEVISWVRQNTPCDARLLTNTRTTGVFEALTGRVNVSEGMGPFLRPDMLADLITRMADTTDFYNDPKENRDFLERNGVDYVLALRSKDLGSGPGWPRASFRALDVTPYLEPLVHERAFAVYKVAPSERTRRELPGTWARCLRTPLQPYEPFER